jgi:poly-gamma-glutamate synthesis protein (capsule biosynthesis protein)
VPHHLVAADLIARAFLLARDNRYDRIVVLTPDHFKRTRRPFATTMRDFDTVYGRVPSDGAAVDALLAATPLVERLTSPSASTASRPPALCRALLPGTPGVPVAAISSNRALNGTQPVDALPLVTPRTLNSPVDRFSHYLLLPEAILHDQDQRDRGARPRCARKVRQPQH